MSKKSDKAAVMEQALQLEELRRELEDNHLKLARSRSTTRQKASALVAAQRRLETLEAEFDFLCAVKPPKRALNRIAKGRKRTGSKDATAVIIASDWHVEETVTLQETHGRGEYNLVIAEQRIERFFQGIVSLVESWTSGSHAAEIRDIVVPMIGDLINGYLREDDLISNSLTPPLAIEWLSQRLVDGFEFLLRNLDVSIHIPCRTGNHGRLMGINAKRTMWAMKETMSLERLLFSMTAAALKDESRITFDIPDGGISTYVNVKGTICRFMHGDSMRYGGGIGGLTVPLVKAIHRYDMETRADHTFLGHFHQTIWLPFASVNGSMIGPNAYSTAGGFGVETPQQSAVLIRQNRGISVRESIWLDR